MCKRTGITLIRFIVPNVRARCRRSANGILQPLRRTREASLRGAPRRLRAARPERPRAPERAPERTARSESSRIMGGIKTATRVRGDAHHGRAPLYEGTPRGNKPPDERHRHPPRRRSDESANRANGRTGTNIIASTRGVTRSGCVRATRRRKSLFISLSQSRAGRRRRFDRRAHANARLTVRTRERARLSYPTDWRETRFCGGGIDRDTRERVGREGRSGRGPSVLRGRVVRRF